MRDKRQKATDVFSDSKPFLGTTSQFRNAFPEIESFQATVLETDAFGDERTMHYSQAHNTGEYVNCSNRLCYNGGFQLGDLLRGMTFGRETHKDFDLFCQGYEGSPKGRVKYGSCDHHFKVAVDITYTDETEEP